ncbi:adhesion G protein-coupled receptor E2-like [Cheilinus undulatus]|uniref:adhesion G protein-coupled receptor E2-like n=1 Tax=Cheilinus undulatus TaxID=241271 RepID=UPI001BD322E6|nr:adhesion G protein-coupled receptor E2-like [Cheilinus undulatus]
MGYATYHHQCNESSCGLLAECSGDGGCVCVSGYEIPSALLPQGDSYGCEDIDECVKTSGICGSYSDCKNNPGSYICVCHVGYEATDAALPISTSNPCKDTDECLNNPCGEGGTCTNNMGSFSCKCSDGFLLDTHAIPLCQDIDECFNSTVCGPDSECTNTPGSYTCACNVGYEPTIPELDPSEENICIDIGECGRHPTICGPYANCTNAIGSYVCTCLSGFRLNNPEVIASYRNPCTDMGLETSGPGGTFPELSLLSAKGNTMEINLEAIAKNNNVNQTEMYSNVITAFLPSINNTNLTEPVNFTMYHKKVPANGMVTCVYWEEKTDETRGEKKRTARWSVDGCSAVYSGENYTVCSCSHLSTFALIMQIGEPPPDNAFLEWLNRMCVIIGLFFFGLAILTFLLCSWNPKINNTARLHLCLNLAFSHLLLLWNDEYTDDELACTVMAGLLHFLVIAGFAWMLLEALQLHLLVRRLTKVQVIQRDGLSRPVLYLVGYGVPFVIVGVSALVYSDGYGATEANLNGILFCATLWSLRPTLANMKSDVSQSKDTRLIIFKILAQFVILGCTWILGLYQTNLFFQVFFIILNSQQGTFLFIVHCMLNKEVREEYIKWLTCSFIKQKHGGSVRDAPSVSEDIDKAEEQTN